MRRHCTTTVPDRIDAATALPALPLITTFPSRMLSPAPQPAPPWTIDARTVVQPGDVIPDAAIDRQPDSRRQRHAQVMPRAGCNSRMSVDPAAAPREWPG